MDGPIRSCPFCGFRAVEYAMLLHVEETHSEGSSPFVVRDAAVAKTEPISGAEDDKVDQHADADQEEGEYTECPVEGCGEILLTKEVEDHLELHAGEVQGGDSGPDSTSDSAAEAGSQAAKSRHQSGGGGDDSGHRREREEKRRHRHHRDKSSKSSRQSSTIQAWRKLLAMPQAKSPSPAPAGDAKASGAAGDSAAGSAADASANAVPKRKRLGKAELGKYAHEKRMPDWLVEHLKKGFGIRQEGVLPVLEQLLEQSPSNSYAYLCHPCVQHVSKLKKEGGFCGYRNIQMMVSYIVGSQFLGFEHFPEGKLPTIFRIQDLIEEAWDKGINAQGRVETGGVKGTRKYIGTPEAQAVFCSLDVPCEAQGYRNKEPGRSEERLLQEIERYFESGVLDPTYKVRATMLPPIYFQHAGHSMTIVGFEKLKNGLGNLLVFDPMFHDAPGITRLVGRYFEHASPDVMLKPYRRGHKYLGKYHEFEVLRLHLPEIPSLGPQAGGDVAGASSKD